jgi:hypothetical protein
VTDIRGYVEQVTRETVRGWAYDAADPARALLIEVLIDGRAVAIGTTDQPRPDLARADTDRDTFGFSVSLPDGVSIELHRLAVRLAGSGETIAMADEAGGYEGFVEVFEGGALKGWAWRCGYPLERVRVIVRHRGDVVGSSLANQLRPDLIEAGVGDGRHAFMIALPMVQKKLDPAHLFAEFEATGAPLTDLRYPDRAPPPPQVIAPPPRAEPSPKPVLAPIPASLRAAPRAAVPLKAPIATRPPMSRMPMARATKAPVAEPGATPRPAPKQPIPPRPVTSPPAAASPPPPAVPAPIVAAPVPQTPLPPPPPPVVLPAPKAAPPPAPVAVVPAQPPTPAPAPPPPSSAPSISKELYEAMRGSLYFGDEGGLF